MRIICDYISHVVNIIQNKCIFKLQQSLETRLQMWITVNKELGVLHKENEDNQWKEQQGTTQQLLQNPHALLNP